MSKKTMRLWSLLLVFVMIFNMLPLHAMAEEINSNQNSSSAETQESQSDYILNDDVYVIEEIIANRTEYSKEFVMNNGLHMAAVYDNAVHYQEDGQWKEIDNSLKLANTRSGNVYTNTAGSWQVSFPQSLTGNNGITISKDEYTLSFRISGELHKMANGTVMMDADANAALGAESETSILSVLDSEESLSLIQPSADIDAVVQEIDRADIYADIQYEETIVDTLHSKLEYANVYDNTDIIFELKSNLVKESIVINQFDATLFGYTYLLDVGEMIPVLTENGEIELYDDEQENVVMLMPAPYLVDNAGEYSYDIQIMLDDMDGTYVLSYLLPQDWLANDTREWPVVLDPAVQTDVSVSNILDQTICSNSTNKLIGSLLCGYDGTVGATRFFIKYSELPYLSPADVIVYASMMLCENAGSYNSPVISVHKVNNPDLTSSNITWADREYMDATVVDYASVHSFTAQALEGIKKFWEWDVTDIVRDWYEAGNSGMMFKMTDAVEEAKVKNYVNFYSSDYSGYQVVEKPTLTIIFRNNNGLEGYWDYTSSSAGRAGTGYVNQYSGNLVWTHSDIGFGGNKMPVSISHIYNSNDCMDYYQVDEDDEEVLVRAANPFGMGNGWRTNFNQQVKRWENSNAYGNYYVWEDADGTSHYFYYDTQEEIYKDEDGMELTLTVASSGYTITDKNGNTSEFDSNGRLHKQSNNQEKPSYIEVTYNSSGFIETIKDGAGRVYTFHYENSLLSKISYQGTDYISFEYDGSNLKKIIDRDTAYCQYEYTDSNLLREAIDVDGYKIAYAYAKEEVGEPSRVATIKEYSGETLGGVLTIEYGQNETTFTDHNGNKQTVQFNNWGNTISIQDDQGRAQYAQYAINEPVAPDDEAAAQTETENDNTAKGNQLRLASKMQNTVGNVLKDSSFENGTLWSATNGSYSSCVIDSSNAYFGRKSLKVTHTDSSVQSGAGSASFTINPDETYTFSAYVKTGESSAYLSIGGASGYLYSETLPKNTDWTRLEVHYTNTTDAAQLVYAFVLSNGPGNTYLDCVQVEKAATASRYNLIENGDFRYTTHWSASGGRTTQEASAAPELNTDVYKLIGDPTATNRISQTVQVSGAEGDVFVLAGWAMGESVPLDDTREFSLIATFNYTDNTTSKSTIRFNPCVDGWQYAAAPIVAEKAYSAILIEVAYDYNANIAYFDGIQLFKEAFGSSYTYDEDGNITAVKDIQGGETTYEYDESGNLSSVTMPDETVTTYEYDQYHNVIKATTSTGVIYDLDYDDYGNNISVTITNGGVSLTSAADYSDDGNILESTTDTAGNTTYYGYNATTNVLEWVKYPKDTEATKTTYSYDTMFRLVSSAVTTDQGKTLSASYTYENDLLKKLTTKSTEYTFDYGSFSRIKSIQAGQRTLASYTYTNDQNNYLDTLAYGNGDSVKYTYDTQGRVIAQTWETGDTVTYKYDNSGALASVTDSATGLTTTYYYDFTDRMMKYVEKGSGFSHSVGYEYDTLNNLTQLVNTINDSILTTAYTYDEDKRIETLLNTLCVDGTNLVNATTIYGYDAFGRLSGKATAVGENSIVSVAYTYRAGTGTTTGQVETLTISTNDTGYNDVYSYTYDGNGNIISVAKGEGDTATVTTYVYDTLNQLIRENNQAAGKTWVWTYDNAGNILAKTEYAYSDPQEMPTGDAITVVYTYGDNQGWGDLLTGYNNHTIRYDTIGNPVEVKNSDGDVVLEYTWEHGRQLAGLHGVDLNGGENDVTVSYTYNADGLRTNKTVTTITYHTHSYTSTVVAPTCTEGGYTAYTCTTCGNSYTDDETAVLGHSYQESVTGPTCTETGYTTYSCAACGDTYTSNETAALGHSYTETVVAPAEDEEGYTLYTCEVCGYSYKDSHLHSYTSTRVNPTCTEAGYTVHTCECGDSYQDSVTAALGHVYEDNGIFAVCKRCGKQSPIYTNPVQPSLPPVVDSETMSLSEEQDDGEALATIKEERTLESTIVTEYDYIYTGTQLMQMIVTTTVDGKTPTTQTLYFTYEASGLMTVTYNGTTYYYAANLQGDIVAILDANGAAVVEYTYDAWGKLLTTTGSLASTLGVTNPLTYRGYVYDTETTLYYLQSRYYNPKNGRFINVDGFVTTGQGIIGNNMYAYCNNNPVMYSDLTGCAPGYLIFPVCIDMGVSKVVCETQGEKSEELLDYVLNDFDLSSASGNVYVNVNYVGKYNKNLIGSIGDAATVIGFLSLVGSFAVKEYLAYKAVAISVKASKALNVFSSIGNTATVVGFGCYATNKLSKLPNGKYDQYTVTISWVQTTPDLFDGLTIHSQICVTMQYVWNDACECGGCWYLLGEVWDQKTTNLYH